MTSPDAIRELLAKASKGYKLPLRYDSTGAMLWDDAGHRVIDVRGWGHLTGGGGLRLIAVDAEVIQDAFGQYVTEAVNSLARLTRENAEMRKAIEALVTAVDTDGAKLSPLANEAYKGIRALLAPSGEGE